MITGIIMPNSLPQTQHTSLIIFYRLLDARFLGVKIIRTSLGKKPKSNYNIITALVFYQTTVTACVKK